METETQLDQAFKKFTDDIVEKIKLVNEARRKMEGNINSGIIDLDSSGGGEVSVQKFEDAMEVLKKHIENRDFSGQHNPLLKGVVSGQAEDQHAIRALEVELVSPQVDSQGKSTEFQIDPNTGQEIRDGGGNKIPIPEWMITGVVVRGLISIFPNDGNQGPTFSSKSSSSLVP